MTSPATEEKTVLVGSDPFEKPAWRQASLWTTHKLENEIGQSADVLTLFSYTLSFSSSTVLKAKRQEDDCLQQIVFLIEK